MAGSARISASPHERVFEGYSIIPLTYSVGYAIMQTVAQTFASLGRGLSCVNYERGCGTG